MKRFELILATVVAITIGTLMHFVHEWPVMSRFVGYIVPVNECVWEHMKMLFYPLFLTGIYLCIRNKSFKSIGGMVAVSLLAIPVQIALFYVYWPFVRHSILIVDIILYVVVMAVAVWVGNRWTLSEKFHRHWTLWWGVAVLMALLMGFLSYHAPDNILFVV